MNILYTFFYLIKLLFINIDTLTIEKIHKFEIIKPIHFPFNVEKKMQHVATSFRYLYYYGRKKLFI